MEVKLLMLMRETSCRKQLHMWNILLFLVIDYILGCYTQFITQRSELCLSLPPILKVFLYDLNKIKKITLSLSRSYHQNKVVVVTVSLLEAEQHFHSVLIMRLASALNQL